MRFKNRRDAGRRLARLLDGYAGRSDVIVLALPRGGVPVAYEVAEALNAPLDVLLVRKLGVPGQEELAMGAIASGGTQVLNDDVVGSLGITDDVIAEIAGQELPELERRERLYRGNRPMPKLDGRTVIVVDDGLATGSTMHAAVAAIYKQHPARIIVAVPIAAASSCESFNRPTEGIRCVCEEAVEPFYAVGFWYEDFDQTTDEEVCKLLQQAGRPAKIKKTRKNAGSENQHLNWKKEQL